MKFSRTLIFIACALCAMVNAAYNGHGGYNSPHYDRYQADRLARQQRNAKAISTLTDMGYDKDSTMFAIGQIHETANLDEMINAALEILNNGQQCPTEVEMHSVEGSPQTHTTEPVSDEKEVPAAAPHVPELPVSQNDLDCFGCIPALRSLMKQIGESKAGKWIRGATSCVTQTLSIPGVTAVYACLKGCDLTELFCCVKLCQCYPKHQAELCIPENTDCKATMLEWMAAVKDAAADCLEGCTCCFAHCAKNITVGTCGSRSRIIMCPQAFLTRCNLDWKKMKQTCALTQEKRICEGIHCCVKGDCNTCEPCCEYTARSCKSGGQVICCLVDEAGACVDFFSCCFYAMGEAGDDMEGLAGFIELIGCCASLGGN